MHPVFLDEFADDMENFLTTNHNTVIAGDFNIHMDNQKDPEAQQVQSKAKATRVNIDAPIMQSPQLSQSDSPPGQYPNEH